MVVKCRFRSQLLPHVLRKSCKGHATSWFLNRHLYVVVFGAVAWTTGVTHIPHLIHSGIVLGVMGVDLMGLVGG